MRVGLMTLGDHLPDPASGKRTSQEARYRQIVDLATRAESLGFDSVWVGEHHLCDYIVPAPPVLLAAIAGRTQTLRLGTSVTLLPNLDPVRAAEDYASLDLLSGGRAELVVGRGILRRTYADFGQDVAQSRRAFVEKLELLLRLWSEEDVQWQGEFRTPLEGVTVQPRPAQRPHPPVWVGGGSSFDSIDLAARLGLPLMLPSVIAPLALFRPHVERYRENFVACGPGRDRPRVGACSHVHVARDSQVALERWRPHHEQYLNWVTRELVPWGAGPNVDGLTDLPYPEFDVIFEQIAVWGSPKKVTERLLEFRELFDLDLHLAMFDHGGIPEKTLLESLELFGEHVLPALTKR
jgi:alkanesulfonate monooxygenase SsuD/methylene tetrahydromethanopterin reductase-like flavin-dependent oxidoreductase (luciferase family)